MTPALSQQGLKGVKQTAKQGDVTTPREPWLPNECQQSSLPTTTQTVLLSAVVAFLTVAKGIVAAVTAVASQNGQAGRATYTGLMFSIYEDILRVRFPNFMGAWPWCQFQQI